MIKQIFKDLLIKPLVKSYLKERYLNLDRQSTPSFSQMGEDMIIKKIFFNKKEKGFYVDIGAFDPIHLSNTYYLYAKGWTGINIDATPGSMEKFRLLRKKDINLEIGISIKKETKDLYIFNHPALNTFSKKTAQSYNKNLEHKLIGKKKIFTKPLSDILDKHLPDKQNIDYLNIDVEGLDYYVLLSNNWKKYIPSVISIEDRNFLLSNPKQSKTYKFLINKKYELVGKTDVTLIFKHKDFLN